MKGSFTWNGTECLGTLPGEYGTILLLQKLPEGEVPAGAVALFMMQRKLVAISDKAIVKEYDRVILLHPTWTIEQQYFLHFLRNYSQEHQWLPSIDRNPVPEHFEAIIMAYFIEIVALLNWWGYDFAHYATVPTKKGGKPRHRWSKAVSTMPFYTEYKGVKATVYWQKRNELILKKGAQLLPETPLNKDGSVGFAAKFALTLRQENSDKFDETFLTTEDVTLKSVNEMGHFLYFAGTNSWQQFKDKEGKTLDEWTIIE